MGMRQCEAGQENTQDQGVQQILLLYSQGYEFIFLATSGLNCRFIRNQVAWSLSLWHEIISLHLL